MATAMEGNGQRERSPELLWHLVQHEMIQSSNQENEKRRVRLSTKPTFNLHDYVRYRLVPDAAWKFPDPQIYRDIYKYGTEKEFKFEEEEIFQYSSDSVYKSWLISTDDTSQQAIVLVVSSGDHQLFPKPGDPCQLGFDVRIRQLKPSADGKKLSSSDCDAKRRELKYCNGFRIDNPNISFSSDEFSRKFFAFKVHVNTNLSPLARFRSHSSPDDLTEICKSGRRPSISLRDERSFMTHV
ncbi:hypothetical protein Daus18300_005496 [Diaporthe australafricana]|uniref:Uncharacterized protein n=1 Tax=Diaporthe australafricana TaxID=127596 RepID=A0ABR3X118_9PEZI